jgi:carbon starvation protein
VWKGGLFPFLFITIACGAVSGFHALIASGTTPKLLASEDHARYIGYGGMLMESFVHHGHGRGFGDRSGRVFRHEQPGRRGRRRCRERRANRQQLGLRHYPGRPASGRQDIGETTILARAGGAPTLAVGIAQILHHVLPGENTMAFWYHFAILFEALFILTAVDAGTRAGRFMLQDLLGLRAGAAPHGILDRQPDRDRRLCGDVGAVGVIDPLGGINTLWPLFGISNQMLAGIALMLGTVVLIKMKRQRYIWVTLLPAVWLLICTTTAGFIKLFDANPAIGFLAWPRSTAMRWPTAVLAPAKDITQMQHVIFNAYTNAT